jgi:hypothetical protein
MCAFDSLPLMLWIILIVTYYNALQESPATSWRTDETGYFQDENILSRRFAEK